MAQQYDHLTLEDRCSIARLHEGGQSIRQIVTALDRSPSTISRELKRNRGAKIGYKPAYAEEQAGARVAQAIAAMERVETSAIAYTPDGTAEQLHPPDAEPSTARACRFARSGSFANSTDLRCCPQRCWRGRDVRGQPARSASELARWDYPIAACPD